MKQGWKQYLLYSGVIIAIGGLIYILFETIKVKNTGFETKALWDWMELLVVPLVLAFGAFILNRSEKNLERERLESRANLEREIAADRQMEAALQAYLDRMSELLLEKNLRSTDEIEVRNVARTRTLTVLRGLDGKRKGIVIKFLSEANLIRREDPVVNLHGADLRDTYLWKALLVDVDLSNTDMSNIDLDYADLTGAKLDNATLFRASLDHTNFTGASLHQVYLNSANLLCANLHNSFLKDSLLENATLRFANLSFANLVDVSLRSSDLNNAHMVQAKMRGANLSGADLRNANLRDAELSHAIFIEEAKLIGATMPDGTIHE